jgi:hypothetical protein
MKTATKVAQPAKSETAFRRVQRQAESIKNDAAHTVETCSAGDAWAQGDLLIVCLPALPTDAKPDPHPSAQLAPGTTQGSRHCIGDLAAVKLYRLTDPTPLDGPLIEAPAGVTIEHPEHGNVTLPAGVYAVVYQRSFGEDLRRVQD